QKKVLFVVDENEKIFGVITDGDIRRWIIKSGGLQGKAEDFCNRNPIVVDENYNVEKVKKIMVKKGIEAIPVMIKDRIKDILFWDTLFSETNNLTIKSSINSPVVIMAGGKGTRLDPFTRILPKPLIPIGDKPIIELIIDRFRKYGVKKYYLSLNHKAAAIKAYFEDQEIDYNIQYICEEKPLGTAGALKLVGGKINESFFVSNCDILIDTDYQELMEYHLKNQNEITLVASIKNFPIPYGVCEMNGGGRLSHIREKPDFDFLVNTGLYILNPTVLKYIPDNSYYDMTSLIEDVRESSKIGVFPISEKAWIDIGQWEEYKNAMKTLSLD
ncbi:MAG TPA: nucleotidyltransferase family protein, partial [Bacteroidales bacterium]|nr:nucleotidyltransferase family protein [Bacteroidales bacterium]